MKKTIKKTLAILVAILMIVTSVPFAFAAEGETKVIYVDDNGMSANWTIEFYDEFDNKLDCTFEEFNYQFDAYTVPTDAVKCIISEYGHEISVMLPENVDAYIADENRWYCSHQMGEGLVENGAILECEICGEIFREIYVNWLISWHLGSYEMKFFDSVGNELFYEIEFIEDNFDLCRVSVDAVSYWFSHSNGASDEGTIPEKVDYYEASSKTWRCSHQLDTNGVKNCLGQICEICGVNYGEADPDAHDWSNCDGICMNGCGTECAHADQAGSACEICGKSLHTCDFSGEWKYDSEKHWKECDCGETEEVAHSYIDGVCECGTMGITNIEDFGCFPDKGWYTEEGIPEEISPNVEGKIEWVNGDEITITMNSETYGTQTAVMTYQDGSWVGDIALAYDENEDLDYLLTVAYGKVDGTEEYLLAEHIIDGSTLQISFEYSDRLYSRLRLVGDANESYEISVTEFMPAGLGNFDSYNYTLTADDNGNAFLYGCFAEGSILTINGVDCTLNYLNGTEFGKSYAICAVHSGTEATCKGVLCENCGLYFGEKDLSKHTLVQVDAKAPTCTQVGNEAYEYCTECDYSTYEEIPASTHIDANCDYKCDYNCGYVYETLDFSDAKVLTAVDGVLYIDGVEAETNSSKSQSRIYEGKYILEGDIETSRYIWILGDTTLDLNGYTWNLTKYINVNAPLSVYDTSEAETGKITSGSSSLTINMNDVATGFNLYGGTIENTSSSGRCALDVAFADVNLYAGKIKGNSYAISCNLGDDVTINIDDTVLESGDDYADVLVALGINAIAKGDIDVTDYKGDSLTAKVNVTSTLGKITVFKGIKNTQEAEKYQIIDVVCNESFDLFWEKTEYDEAAGEKSIYTANNAFTQQPSADNNLTVDFNNTAATFQWYEVEEKNLGVYTAEEFSPLFTYEFKAGDILKVSTDSELRHVVIETGIIDTDYEYINLRENEKTATITFDADTTVDLFVAIVNADNPVEVNFTVFKEAKLDGETEKTLQKVECGKSYYCKATVGENVYISDTVNILPVEHDLIQVDAKAPTCTEIGWDAYEYCTTCTYTTYVELPVDADAHDWSNKDGICKLCGADCEHESYTDGVCDVCGYECPHTETYETVTQLEHFSVQNPDGTWTKATVGVVCWECYKILEEKEADRADYTEFDEIMAKICEYLDSGKLIDNAYNSYSSTINSFKNNIYIIGSPFQSTPDSYVESLKYMLNEIEAGIADGKMIKADFTYMTSLFDEINALIDNDPNKLIPSESGRFQGIYYGFYMSCKNNGNHSQFDYDRNMADNDYEGQIEGVLAGIKDGTALKADYTEIDEAIASLDEKLADVNLTDEAKAELEEIKTQLTEMKNNPLSSKADVEELMKAVEELEAGVEDGTIVLVDASKIFAEYDIAHSDDLEEKYGKEKVDKVFFKIHIKNPEVIDSIWEYADSITGTVAETADEIEEIKRMFDNLYEGVERCIIGTHNIEEYEVISPAKCGVNAIESATCTLCCDELTREVENSALTHSFTEYEVVDAPTCGKAGKKVAACDNGCGAADEKEIEALTHSFTEYEVVEEPTCGKVGKEAATCDNGCGATDEKEIPTLEHIFLEYKSNDDATCTDDGTKTAECENGCGETDTVTDEGTMLDHTDEDGDKICDDCQAEIIDVCPDCGGAVHEGQLAEYICTLVTLIKLIVSLVQFIQQFTA